MDEIDDKAFATAVEAANGLPLNQAIRAAITAYLAELHLHVSRVHSERTLTPEEAIEAFRPRVIEG